MNPILNSIINKQRRDFEQLSSGRNIPAKVLDGVQEEHNICYKKDGDRAHMMDLYCPNTVKIPTPVIINVHGGGLIMGSKEFNRHFCINLCKMGFLVFSVEYRLCPEATVFQQLEDIFAAMNCIDGMMPQLKAELGHCYMVGDSAGAMLAMYASAIQRNPRLAKAAGVRPSYLEILSLALISGMFYTTRKDSIGLILPKAFYGENYKKHPFYPGVITVGEDGALRLEIGGSENYILSCLNSSVEIPEPGETLPAEETTDSENESGTETVADAEATTDPSEGTAQEETISEGSEATEEQGTIAGIPVTHIALFGGGLIVAIGALVGINFYQKRSNNNASSDDDDDEI